MSSRYVLRSFEKSSVPVVFYSYPTHLDPHTFPTRRSSDLADLPGHGGAALARGVRAVRRERPAAASSPDPAQRDRKSTRLNSSHANTSYAVFCLKKKSERHQSKKRANSRRVAER